MSFIQRNRLFIIILGTIISLILLAWTRDYVLQLPTLWDVIPTTSNAPTPTPVLDKTAGTEGDVLTGLGPDYARFTLAEQALPQHNLDLPFPEGRTGRYVRFSNQMNRIGWNNVLSELLLASHLAWRSKRAYVWQDYWWEPSHYPWKENGWPHTPLTALISGPTVGSPWPGNDTTPRSISDEWFKVVCPEDEVFKLDASIAREPVAYADGTVYMDHWVKLLSEHEARCIEVVGGPTFDIGIIGSDRVLSLWPEFRDSPVSRLLGPSPLVLQALNRNMHLLYPPSSKSSSHKPYNYDPFPHILAIHVRRQDYFNHCVFLAGINSSYWEFLRSPQMVDPYFPLPIDFPIGSPTPEAKEHLMERCLPSNEYIAKKILQCKEDWESVALPPDAPKRSIEIIYVMTNGERAWVNELSRLLKGKAGGGNHFHVVTSKDMQFDFEETGVGMVVDMEIGAKAAVFIGNGWSSFSGSIIHRRLVKEEEWISSRLW